MGATVAPSRVLLPFGVLALFLAATLGAGLLGARTASSPPSGPPEVAGIPPEYLAAYEAASARFRLGDDGWSYLAGIGEVESDHGRSTAPGVHSGENAYGCCAGPMQINNVSATGGKTTWDAYRTDGDGDGGEDIYDPADAVATAARYLKASGAPGGWQRAIFAYNHADWYVADVERQAAAYRSATTDVVVSGGGWLATVPGTGERCDARILPDVVNLIAAYGLRLTACYGGAPHARHGEHPLGLAADLVPVDGDWDRTLSLAEAYGWSPGCASTGCGGRGPFRVILYNGYPGHGDPAHSSTPHLHLSWQHGPAAPFTRVPWVRVLVDSSFP